MRGLRFFIVYLLILAAALFIHQKRDYDVPVVKSLATIPTKHGDWTMFKQARFDKRTLAVLLPTEYISRTYIDQKGNAVELYLGYHDGSPGTGGIHSPKNCLPGSGWYRVSEKIETLSFAGKKIPLVSAVYQKGSTNELFLYWYQVRGKYLTNEYALKLAKITGSIFYNRKDAAFIRISVPFDEDFDQAFTLGRKFIGDFYAEFDAVLPK